MDNVNSFEALYESLQKCKRGVMWKESVSSFWLNGLERTLKLEDKLRTGKYKAKEPLHLTITHPKKREAVSIAFVDRVYA